MNETVLLVSLTGGVSPIEPLEIIAQYWVHGFAGSFPL